MKPCKGEFHVDIFKGGRRVDSFGDHNLVVESGRVRLAELAAGKSSAYITQIGIGEGSTTEKDTDTALSQDCSFSRGGSRATARRFRHAAVADRARGCRRSARAGRRSPAAGSRKWPRGFCRDGCAVFVGRGRRFLARRSSVLDSAGRERAFRIPCRSSPRGCSAFLPVAAV